MSFWSEENEVQFIRLIQERPPLYDISEKTYSNRGVKTELWHEIENELDIPEKELRKRWESLRTQYNRYKKQLPEDGFATQKTGRQQWILSLLQFLEPHTKRRDTTSNLTIKEPSAAATVSESPPQGPSSETWNPPEDACLYEAESDANPSPHAAESTLCGAESTQMRFRDETRPTPSPFSRPLGPRPWMRRGRRALGKPGAEEPVGFMRTVGRNLERLASQRGPGDAISAYCRSLELRMRQMPKHTLPYFQHEVDSCLFNYTVEQGLPPELDQGLQPHQRHLLDQRERERYDPKSVSLEALERDLELDSESECERVADRRQRLDPDLDAELERKRVELELEHKRAELELEHKRAELRREAELAQELEQTCRRLQELRRRREQRRRELQVEVCLLERRRERSREHQRRAGLTEGAAAHRRELRRRTLEPDTQPLMETEGREVEVEVELDC